MNPFRTAIACLLLVAWTAQSHAKPYDEMDYGPYFTMSLEAPGPAVADIQEEQGNRGKLNIAQKGLVIRLGEKDEANVCFDTDLMRYSAVWTGGLVDWRSIVYDGSHGTWPKLRGEFVFGNGVRPGWADAKGSFEDVRMQGSDKRRFGPLDRKHAKWKGLYLNGNQVILSYTVGDADVLETPGLAEAGDKPVFTRTLNIGKSSSDLTLQVAEDASQKAVLSDPAAKNAVTLGPLAIAASGDVADLRWAVTDAGQVRLTIPATATPCKLTIYASKADASKLQELAASSKSPADLAALTKGGPRRWPDKVTTKGQLNKFGNAEKDAYVADEITAPVKNPWKSWMRFGGFDFFDGGKRAAVCTWNGDVWLVDGIDGDLDELVWQRIATGMFQPLGLKIVDGNIYVTCRDQITLLHDLNGDEEIGFYEAFKHDHQVTEHFHEFAMDLQTDADGNFYYAKSARHAKDSLVPHHGTLIRVSPDGKTSEIVCNGFRAATGAGIGPDGLMATSDQEGHWTPANRINLVKQDGFYGNMYSYHRGERPEGYDPPVVWLAKGVDRSPAAQLWVTSDKWGPLKGSMLSTSYGTGKILLVPYEFVDGTPQGAAIRFPLEFPTGTMRGRFHEGDGQLYVCGLFGWSSNKTLPGGFYRVRYTGKPVHMPVATKVGETKVAITFATPLDRESAEDIDNYAIEQWNYKWSSRYGSPHLRPSTGKKGQDEVELLEATLSDDGKTVELEIEDLEPVMSMQIDYRLKDANGQSFKDRMWMTINKLGED
ncbi:MAG: cytochrome C oxidase Cbb3 [Pirellulales bacterium]|nr:cytochrome C oxidase Cbb3 [Pirellulales bacterium]